MASTIRYYASQFSLKESTIRGWRDSYIKELKKRKVEKKSMDVTELPEKRRGRPLLLGAELDRQVQAYITTLRKNGAVVNTAIVMACAEGIVCNKDSNLLSSNGGYISLTKDWGKSLLRRMGLVKRRASTKSKVSIENFEELKEQYLLDIKACVEMDEVPDELIINWDQTGIHYVPVSSWTMEKEGSKRVEIAGIDDKRQITAVFGCCITGDFDPFRLYTRVRPRSAFHPLLFLQIGMRHLATTIGLMRILCVTTLTSYFFPTSRRGGQSLNFLLIREPLYCSINSKVSAQVLF